jgi:hypothetical protein
MLRCAFLLAVFVTLASAEEVSGSWKAWFVGEKRVKTPGEMTFELKVDGSKVTGMAHMPNWPGDAEITGAKLAGNRLSFTVTGNSPWWSSGPGGEKSSGYPKIEFEWQLKGSEADIKLVWGNVMIYGTAPEPMKMEMKAKKQ